MVEPPSLLVLDNFSLPDGMRWLEIFLVAMINHRPVHGLVIISRISCRGIHTLDLVYVPEQLRNGGRWNQSVVVNWSPMELNGTINLCRDDRSVIDIHPNHLMNPMGFQRGFHYIITSLHLSIGCYPATLFRVTRTVSGKNNWKEPLEGCYNLLERHLTDKIHICLQLEANWTDSVAWMG